MTRNLTLSVLFLVALLAFAPAAADAQATNTPTTLASAVAVSDQVVNVASATGITAPGTLGQISTYLFMDREMMAVTAVNSTAISVRRGANATPVTAHASGELVWLGPASYFVDGDPSGACVAGQQIVLPLVAVRTGRVFDCPASGVWSIGSGMLENMNRVAVNDAAYTLKLTDYIVGYTAITAARAVTIPSASVGLTGRTFIIKDESGSATSSYKINITGTVDGSTTFACVSAAYGYCRLYCSGAAWFSY